MTAARIQSWWYGLMLAGGIGFGLIGDQRPFGDDILFHPLVILFAVAAAGLLILRVVMARPAQELIPERTLLIGCILGAGAFLAGNWITIHLLAVH
jgi:hypothetical protein